MASNTLFPPVVNNVEPAFITCPATVQEIEGVPTYVYPTEQPGKLKVYFKFSALNSGLDTSNISVHATIHLKETGASVVKIVDGEINQGTFLNTRRLRATKIILNLKPVHVENTKYWYVILENDDVDMENVSVPYYGWCPGNIYKIQIRLSEVLCDDIEEEMNQQKWLYDNADHFSEWSEVIYSKCISDVNIEHYDQYYFITDYFETMPSSAEEMAQYEGKIVEYIGTTTSTYTYGNYYTCIETNPQTYSWVHEPLKIYYSQEFQGAITCIDSNSKEHYSSCSLKIYESDDNQGKGDLIEEATIYPSDISYDNYKYTIMYNFDTTKKYLMEFSFITDNKYQSDIFYSWFQYVSTGTQICDYKINTVDVAGHPLVKKVKDGDKYYTSLGLENDEGCIGLKLEFDPTESWGGYANINLRILRTDEYSNFSVWEEIHYINLKLSNIQTDTDLINALDRLPIFYDYTIESNTFYQYALQSMIEGTEYWTYPKKLKDLQDQDAFIQRDFEFSYLLGKNQKQLKIKFNDNINNYIQQVYDAKLEPVGSKYPYINRNSKINYKIFPISGTISFEMDDNETFLPNGSLDIYGQSNVVSLHNNIPEVWKWKQGKYDYGYERRFRQKVLEFLQDGENKLFKSATEGNVLVRLTDISCTPNQQLSRLIYNFSGTAVEVDDNKLVNLKKYGILYPGTYVTDWNDIKPILIDYGTGEKDPPHSHGPITTVIDGRTVELIVPTNVPPVPANGVAIN